MRSNILSEIAGVKLQSTALGCFWAVFMGLSGVIVSQISGVLLGQGHGLEVLFLAAAVFSSFALVILVALVMARRRVQEHC